MKGGLASMMRALHDPAGQSSVHVHFVCVSDEESEEVEQRGSDHLVEKGYVGDFAITGEPTDMHIGIQAKGVLATAHRGHGQVRARLHALGGRQRGAEGDRRVPAIETLPFARESSDLFDRPSINLPDLGRRRAQQGARPVRDRRGRALPAGPGARGDPGRRERAGRRHGRQGLPPPARDRGP